MAREHLTAQPVDQITLFNLRYHKENFAQKLDVDYSPPPKSHFHALTQCS